MSLNKLLVYPTQLTDDKVQNLTSEFPVYSDGVDAYVSFCDASYLAEIVTAVGEGTRNETVNIAITNLAYGILDVTVADYAIETIDYPVGDVDYPNNALETWSFLLADGFQSFNFHFTFFETEANYDYLYVYSGTDDTGTLIATLHGTSLPADIFLETDVFLKFDSDAGVTDRGFIVEVTKTFASGDGSPDVTVNDTTTNLSYVAEVVTVVDSQTTVSHRIANSVHDAEEDTATGAMDLTSSDIELGADGTEQIAGLKFINLNIPKNATINQAFIQFTCDEVTSTAIIVKMQGQAEDNPSDFSATTSDISSRARTTEIVLWDIEPWYVAGRAGEIERTPNIASLIQEIVNRPTYLATDGIVIIIESNGGYGTSRRVAESYDGVPASAPELTVSYIESTGVNVDVNDTTTNINLVAEVVTAEAIQNVTVVSTLLSLDGIIESVTVTTEIIVSVDANVSTSTSSFGADVVTVNTGVSVNANASTITSSFIAEVVSIATAGNLDVNVATTDISLVAEEVVAVGIENVSVAVNNTTSNFLTEEVTVNTEIIASVNADILALNWLAEVVSIETAGNLDINTNTLNLTLVVEESTVEASVNVSLGVNSSNYTSLDVSVVTDADVVLETLISSYVSQIVVVDVSTGLTVFAETTNIDYEVLEPSIVLINSVDNVADAIIGSFEALSPLVSVDNFTLASELLATTEVLDATVIGGVSIEVDLDVLNVLIDYLDAEIRINQDVYLDEILLSLGIDSVSVDTTREANINIINVNGSYNALGVYVATVSIDGEIIDGISRITNSIKFNSKISSVLSKFSKIK
jgi:hypothetical protein